MRTTAKRSDNTARLINQLTSRLNMTFSDCSYGNDESDSCETEWNGVRIQVFLPNPTDESYNNFVVKIDSDESYYLSNDKGEDAFDGLEETINQIQLYTISH